MYTNRKAMINGKVMHHVGLKILNSFIFHPSNSYPIPNPFNK